jgi:hypothetical protein
LRYKGNGWSLIYALRYALCLASTARCRYHTTRIPWFGTLAATQDCCVRAMRTLTVHTHRHTVISFRKRRHPVGAVTAIMKQRAGKTRGLDEERNRSARDSCAPRNYIRRTHSGNRSSFKLPPVKDKAMLFFNCQGVYMLTIQQFNRI